MDSGPVDTRLINSRPTNFRLGVEFGPERKVNPVPRRLADISKAERMLGFRAEIPLENGLRDLVAWWQEQREAVCA
jgi:UDP-glucose 4-epimerase